jgi:hypothetical protein
MMRRKLPDSEQTYRAASWSHAGGLVVLIWIAIWEAACVSTFSSGARIGLWTAVNVAIAVAGYHRIKRMGIAPKHDALVLRYFWFRRVVPYEHALGFRLVPQRGGRTLYLDLVDGKKYQIPAGQFAAASRKETWLRTQRLIWTDGESTDIVGTLDRVLAGHSAIPHRQI